MPVSVTLRYKDGVYVTDSHVEHMVQLGATETVLSQLVRTLNLVRRRTDVLRIHVCRAQ